MFLNETADDEVITVQLKADYRHLNLTWRRSISDATSSVTGILKWTWLSSNVLRLRMRSSRRCSLDSSSKLWSYLLYQFYKRVLDITLFIAILPFALLPISVGLLASLIAHRSVPWFTQERTGLNGVPFLMFKIKTMRDCVPGADNSDNARLSKVGKFLRSVRCDELPQLFNILRGEMSFIGPRPQIHAYYDMMSEHEKSRYSVLPGISGWSQINGRNNVSWEQRFSQDIWYVENASMALDLWIMWRTIVVVLLRRDINRNNYATMEPYNDNPYNDNNVKIEVDKSRNVSPLIDGLISHSHDAIVTFSLRDSNELNIVSTDPRHLFSFYNQELTASEPLECRNIYFDAWICPNGNQNSFPLATVGPFDVIIDEFEVKILEKAQTAKQKPTHRRHTLKCVKTA